MELLFKASINVDHHAIKKNSRCILRNRATNRPFIGKSTALTVAEKILITRLMQIKLAQRLYEPITCDVQCTLLFYFSNYWIKKNSEKRRSKKLGDLSNLYQLPEDCLVKAGILIDDSIIQSHDGSRILPSDVNKLEIFISKLV